MRVLAECAATAAHWTPEMYACIFDPQALIRLVLALEEEKTLVGFLVAQCAGPEWELENIVVAERLRRQGCGKRLLEDLLRRAGAAGAEGVFLEVRESNWPARQLYRSAGFVESGRKRGYYQNPDEDGIVSSWRRENQHSNAQAVDSASDAKIEAEQGV
jgi:ribosomal-protein-alanine N-acetyltransferase